MIAGWALLGALITVVSPQPNPAPVVVPSLQRWDGGVGTMTLTSRSRLVVPSGLRPLAGQFAGELAGDGGPRLRVTVGKAPRPGDVALRLGAPGLGAEGYRLDIGSRTTIHARTRTGLFYGTRTLLQILRADPHRRSLPRGRAYDRPRFADRGQMLDVGRKYFPVSYLKAQIRRMGWYKLNRFHLHLTDWNGFRIRSDRFPGLAARESYSKAELRDLQAYAARHHVTIVPEIDLPAHAVAISRYDPKLAFACRSMSYPSFSLWEGSDRGGWTLDVTKPRTRAFVRDLLDEMIPLFKGPEFHIGGDEVPPPRDQDQCPELVADAKAKGHPYPADVFVEFMNDLNAQVRAHGKTTQIWTGWDEGQRTSLVPDTNIQVVDWRSSLLSRARAGYQVIGAQDPPLYVSPGWARLTGNLYGYSDPRQIYERYEFAAHPSIRGYRLARWSDRATGMPVEWFDFWARRPLQALADRTWGAPRRRSLPAFLDRVDQAGGAPPGSGTLLSQQGWRGPAARAFDNDPYTHWVGYRLPAEVVIDLGAARTISGWRHHPRQDGGTDGRIARYELYVSNSTARWGRPAITGALRNEQLERVVRFKAPVTGRYVKLRILGEHGPWRSFASLAELDLLSGIVD